MVGRGWKTLLVLAAALAAGVCLWASFAFVKRSGEGGVEADPAGGGADGGTEQREAARPGDVSAVRTPGTTADEEDPSETLEGPVDFDPQQAHAALERVRLAARGDLPSPRALLADPWFNPDGHELGDVDVEKMKELLEQAAEDLDAIQSSKKKVLEEEVERRFRQGLYQEYDTMGDVPPAAPGALASVARQIGPDPRFEQLVEILPGEVQEYEELAARERRALQDLALELARLLR